LGSEYCKGRRGRVLGRGGKEEWENRRREKEEKSIVYV
jgi:hypothetical protein